MSEARNNYKLRDEIKDYWSLRAEKFDLSAGHEIFTQSERDAWYQLITEHIGAGKGRKALDLASGTGVISHLLFDLGFQTTGLDWSETMLAKAREKSEIRKSDIKFIIGDAENTMQPLGTFEVITMRHLVWTLVDPKAAMQHWFDLLQSGGKLLIVDGNFKQADWRRKLIKMVASLFSMFEGKDRHGRDAQMMKTHNHILQRVYFNQGVTSVAVVEMLTDIGFKDISVQTDLSTIHRAQAKGLGFFKFLDRSVQHRFAISASKP
ncbi:MAG: methyltransferase domain-containing protein [Alphaproteobacteria bacterium]|nr:methyltransferase domain-containing protein [Alphaproteobacteria bacterium]